MNTKILKSDIEELGYNVVSIDDNIWMVEDFLSDQEQSDLFEIINSKTQEDWEHAYKENLKSFCMEKFGRDDIDNLVAEGKFEVTDNWHDKVLHISRTPVSNKLGQKVSALFKKYPQIDANGVGIIQRQYAGVELKSHTDQHTDPSIVYAVVIYINDDYTDGELFFPKKNIKIKPKAKSMIIFPGDDDHEHGVIAPGEGPLRYVLPCFIHIKDFYKENKY